MIDHGFEVERLRTELATLKASYHRDAIRNMVDQVKAHIETKRAIDRVRELLAGAESAGLRYITIAAIRAAINEGEK
jgi:hypothetical protein